MDIFYKKQKDSTKQRTSLAKKLRGMAVKISILTTNLIKEGRK